MTTSRFQQGLAAQQLLLQVCRACGQVHALERFCCSHCHRQALDWRPASGWATVHAITEISRAPTASFKALVPYTVVVARLEEGPLIMGHADADVAIGTPIQARFKLHEGVPLLHFVPA